VGDRCRPAESSWRPFSTRGAAGSIGADDFRGSSATTRARAASAAYLTGRIRRRLTMRPVEQKDLLTDAGTAAAVAIAVSIGLDRA
jgi:hypothetical protein